MENLAHDEALEKLTKSFTITFSYKIDTVIKIIIDLLRIR